MVRITLFLLLLLLRNNAYAWYCNFQPDSQGNIIPGSMSCSGISNDDALQNHYCGWYRPNDPYCSIYQVPVCSPQVEYQTLVAQLINQVLLIKLGLMNVLHSLGQGGQQLLTTVRQILQRVLKH
jgi:hypothetical protein